MIILDGKKLSEKILEDLKKKIQQENLKLSLVVILVGENPASLMYIKQKEEKAKELRVSFELKKIREEISVKELKEEINNVVFKKPTGIIIQLPLPFHLKKNQSEILNLIPLKMDVDVLSQNSRSRIGQKNALLPPTVAGILRLLKEYKIDLKNKPRTSLPIYLKVLSAFQALIGKKVRGKKIVVVGRGFLVGEPLIKYLETQGLDVESADEFTEDLKAVTQKADILITGVGKPGLIKADMVKRGVVVVDAGISKVGNKLQGDTDFESVSQKVNAITPVPGGVGPMTVAMIFENLVKLTAKF